MAHRATATREDQDGVSDLLAASNRARCRHRRTAKQPNA